MTINLNCNATAVLSEAGYQRWRKSFYDLGLKPDEFKKSWFRSDDPMRWSGQLWEAFKIWGRDCYDGNMEVPFMRNEIELAIDTEAQPGA